MRPQMAGTTDTLERRPRQSACSAALNGREIVVGVTCIKVELENELPGQMSYRFQATLANLIEGTQELTGWTSSVNLIQATDDGQQEPGAGDLDAEAEKLLPSGEQLTASLMEDIQHEEAVYAAADLFQALPLEDLCTEDLDGLGSAAMRRASALAGCLIYAADIVIDELIDDIVNLRDEESDTSTSAIEDTWVLCQLPARFAVDYSPLFAQKLLVAVVDVTGRLTKGWEPLACVAQELGLRVLLNQVEVVAESADVTLDDGSSRSARAITQATTTCRRSEA